MNTETIFNAYVSCALWSSTDDCGNPLDDTFSDSDIAPETFQQMRGGVSGFIGANSENLAASGLGDSQIGHDFWLARNRHGAGFWDRGLGAIGDALSDAAHAYGSVDLYAGDDGRVYA